MKLKKSIVSMICFLGIVLCTMAFGMKVQAAPPTEASISENEWKMLKDVNKVRYDNGLNPVVSFPKLQLVGDIRTSEMMDMYVTYGYDGAISNVRPNDTWYNTVLQDDNVQINGYEYYYELRAFAFTRKETVNAFSTDPQASSIFLNPNYNCMGVGCQFAGISDYWSLFYLKTGTLSSLQVPSYIEVDPGTTLADMDLCATVNNSIQGTCYFPILPEYCTGYDANKGGTQTVTVSVLGMTQTMKIKVKTPETEKPYKITNTVSGVHVYWKAVDGISQYGLWRSENGVNGTYKCIATTTALHYTDTGVTSGKKYYYRVTCINPQDNTHYEKSEAAGTVFVGTPDLTLRVNRASGIGLGWNAIEGATGYAIYRKPYYGNEAWVRVHTITDPTQLTWDDTSVKANNGEVYRYTVRALAGSKRNILSGCRSTGRTMVRLTSRSLNSATKASATSIKCAWSTSTQSTGYEVRFMVGNTVYKTYTIGNYKTGVKTFTGLKAGQTYKIQVRTYKKVDGVGSFYSAWSTAKTVTL